MAVPTHYRLLVIVSLLILLGRVVGMVPMVLVSLAYQGSKLRQELLYLAKAALLWTINRCQKKVRSSVADPDPKDPDHFAGFRSGSIIFSMDPDPD